MKLELQMVVIHHMGTGNQTWVLFKNNELWLWLGDRGVYLLPAASLLHDCAHEPGNMGKTLKDPNNGEFWEGHIQNE